MLYVCKIGVTFDLNCTYCLCGGDLLFSAVYCYYYYSPLTTELICILNIAAMG